MEGFTIGRKGAFLERVKSDVTDIGLLSQGDGTEVLIQSIEKDKLFYIYPAECAEVMEFYFILSGEVVCEIDNEKLFLGPHDYFTAQGLSEPIHFTVLSEVALLSVTTDPVFVHLSEKIYALMDVVKQVEAKDPYTYKHSDRVAEYAVKIAKKMRLSKNHLEKINKAASLHDIGKINIPKDVLNKPASLTAEEFSLIKNHPGDGAGMLKGTLHEEIALIIEQHHERLNGSGYPHGLKGEDILLEARIIAVSDTYDAMTEDRAYRKAFSPDYALKELKQLAGTHYDSAVVHAFEEILKEEGRIGQQVHN